MTQRLWPVDRLMIIYLAAISTLVALFARSIEHSGVILAAHALGVILILACRNVWFRHWYPLLYVALCYREMSIIIASVWTTNADRTLAAWDHAIWRTHPTVWLERIQSPLLTELLQLAYSLFVPAVLLVAVIFWRQNRLAEFRSYAFLLTLGFLSSYIGYLLVPARGPRFFLADVQTEPLRGLWLYPRVRAALDLLESAHYDCFPSGHVEMTVLAWWTSRRISAWLGRTYAVYTAILIFTTVYLRYHYSVDLMAGLAVAAIVLAAAPRLMKGLNGGQPPGNAG